jgi:hypothetical protein
MDTTSIVHSLRTLSPLNVVVSLEPVHVVKAVSTLARRNVFVRVVTRYGVMHAKEYLQSYSLRRGDEVGQITPLKSLDEMQAEDPRGDDLLVFVLPDIWPYMHNPEVMAAFQRVRDARLTNPKAIKMAFTVVPDLDSVPKTFQSLFDVHYDKGLTLEQAVDTLEEIFTALSIEVSSAATQEMAQLCVGRLTSEVWRMVSHAVVRDRESLRMMGTLGPEGVRDWLVQHNFPVPA